MKKNIRISYSEKKFKIGLEKVGSIIKINEKVELQIHDVIFISIKNYFLFRQYVIFGKNELIIFNLNLNKKISSFRRIKYFDFNVDFCINPTIIELILDNKNYYLVISSRIRPIEDSYLWSFIFNLITIRYESNLELRNSLLSKINTGSILKNYSIILGYYFINSMMINVKNKSWFINQEEIVLINNKIIKEAIQNAYIFKDNKVRLSSFNDYIWYLQIPFDFHWRIIEINKYFRNYSIPSFKNMERYMVYHDLLIYINDSFEHATKNPGTKMLGQSTRYFGYLNDNEKPIMYSYSDFEKEHKKAIDKLLCILESNDKKIDLSV